MSKSFDELVSVMARLRAPGGCPWDAEQTYASLSQYLLEECYETFDAIHEADATGDTTNLREELGDVLLQVGFHSTIAAEKGDFTIDEVVAGVSQKLILRHPHVFGTTKVKDVDEVWANWEKIKHAEKKGTRWTKGDLTGSDPVVIPVDPKSMAGLTSQGPASPAARSAAPATRLSARSRRSCWSIRETVIPTETRAATSPRSSRTGTTERIDAPRVPVYSWVKT